MKHRDGGQDRQSQDRLHLFRTSKGGRPLLQGKGGAVSQRAADQQARQHDHHQVGLFRLLRQIRRIQNAEGFPLLALFKILGHPGVQLLVQQGLVVPTRVFIIAHEDRHFLLALRRPLDAILIVLDLGEQALMVFLERGQADLAFIPLAKQFMIVGIGTRRAGRSAHGLRLCDLHDLSGALRQLRLDVFDLVLHLDHVRIGVLVFRPQGGQGPLQFPQPRVQMIPRAISRIHHRHDRGRLLLVILPDALLSVRRREVSPLGAFEHRHAQRFIGVDRFRNGGATVVGVFERLGHRRQFPLQSVQMVQIRLHLRRQLAHVLLLEVADRPLLVFERRFGAAQFFLEKFRRAFDELLADFEIFLDELRREARGHLHGHHGILMGVGNGEGLDTSAALGFDPDILPHALDQRFGVAELRLVGIEVELVDDLQEQRSAEYLLLDHRQPLKDGAPDDRPHVGLRDFLRFHQDQGAGSVHLGEVEAQCPGDPQAGSQHGHDQPFAAYRDIPVVFRAQRPS